MQVVFRCLLAATLAAWVASCALNDHGLGAVAGQPAGAAGASAGSAGASGDAGAAGMIAEPSGAAGAPTSLGGATGAAGGPTGTGGAAGDSSGTAGDPSGGGSSGTAGTAGPTDGTGVAGAAGTPASGGAGGVTASSGTAGASSDGAGDASAAGAGGATQDPGCSDGTREGYLDLSLYPNIAACAGAWDTPGLSSTDARTPQCDRRSGNDGDKADGRGCSVADLCESGWHVCETAHAVSAASMNAGCDDAIAPAAGKTVFYVTLQRANGLACDSGAQAMGTNNVYGCGNFGSAADKNSCAPFKYMLRDTDCQANPPWICTDGPLSTSTDEYDVITKSSATHGGALCCRD
jgi:hypothetical protein